MTYRNLAAIDVRMADSSKVEGIEAGCGENSIFRPCTLEGEAEEFWDK